MPQRRVRAEHPDVLRPVGGLGGDSGQPQRHNVLDESTQRRTGRARHKLIGGVEQRGHRVEIPGGLGAARAAALAGRQPAPLQTGPLPRGPQRVARILAVAIAACGRVQHGTHASQRPGEWRFAGQRLHQQVAETAGRTNGLGALKRSAQLAQRDRVDAADGPGQQLQSACPVKPVGGGGQHREQRMGRGFFRQRAPERGWGHRNTGGRQGPWQPRASACHRANDHRHLRPRHPVHQMGTPQRVGDHRRLRVRRGSQPHGDRSIVAPDAVDAPAAGAAGQSARDAADRARDGWGAAMRLGQGDRRSVFGEQPGGLAAAEAEHRLAGITGNQGQIGGRGQHPNQAGRLRIELLGVVDQQHADPGAFGRQQFRVDRESLQRSPDQFGGTQRRRRRLRRRRPDRRP